MEMWDCALQGRPVRPTICRMTAHDTHYQCNGCLHYEAVEVEANSVELVKKRGKNRAKNEREG